MSITDHPRSTPNRRTWQRGLALFAVVGLVVAACGDDDCVDDGDCDVGTRANARRIRRTTRCVILTIVFCNCLGRRTFCATRPCGPAGRLPS